MSVDLLIGITESVGLAAALVILWIVVGDMVRAKKGRRPGD